MNTQLSFILLLDILENKGYLTHRERRNISSIEALTNLLKTSTQTPPMDDDWKIFELGWEKFQKAQSKVDKLSILIEISEYTESETINKVVGELLELVERLDKETHA